MITVLGIIGTIFALFICPWAVCLGLVGLWIGGFVGAVIGVLIGLAIQF